jgi:hypothetical protein
MNGFDELCVVCGDPSTTLICDECETLLHAKPRASRVPNAPTPASARSLTTLAGIAPGD